MPVPESAEFTRLAGFAAVDAAGVHATRTITEVFTGQVLGEVPVGAGADVSAAIARARTAQVQWAARPAAERARVLDRYRALVVQQREYLMDVIQAETGRTLARQCGDRLIGFSAELGGKNPMIVARGADLAKAARAAVRACFSNAGQLCISIERLYVDSTVAAEFTDLFTAAVRAAKLGAAYDFSADIGSLISAAQLETVTKHVADAVSKGATVLAGGNARPDLGPLFFEPTVLSGVSQEMECARNETFGPLVSIYPVSGVEEAIDRANDTEYGLNASVWAASTADGQRIAERLQAGTVCIDEGYAPAWGTTAAPMGGMGISGVGRRHGPDGLLKFTEPQSVVATRWMNLDPPFGLPQSTWQPALMTIARAIRFLPGR